MKLSEQDPIMQVLKPTYSSMGSHFKNGLYSKEYYHSHEEVDYRMGKVLLATYMTVYYLEHIRNENKNKHQENKAPY